jgi:hypothetical protein
MQRLVWLGAALTGSIVFYLAVFSFVHRPLTLGDIPRLLEHKSAHAKTLNRPKLVIFAGSNGRYSHRCEAMAEALGRPCVNMSIGVGIGLDFQFDRLRPLLAAGDIVYMPLEYREYATTRDKMEGGPQNIALVREYRDQLFQQPWRRVVRAYAYFDLPTLIHGSIEMALERRGYQRRTSLDSLTREGDESGHTREAGAPYVAFLRASRYGEVELPRKSYAIDVLQAFLREARARGVTVVGGLPTIPDSVTIPNAVLTQLDELYAQQGQHFLLLDNRAQYPLDCFFDTLSHLNEACQIAHSRRVGAALRALDFSHAAAK